MEVLICNCGDCAHWEVVFHLEDGIHLHCQTCQEMLPITIKIENENKVHWRHVTEKRKKWVAHE